MEHFKRLLAACLIAVLCMLAVQKEVVRASGEHTTLESEQVTNWGSWGPWEYCPAGTFVIGMKLKTLPPQGRFTDDSGLNAVRFYCAPVAGKIDPNNPTHITSSVGPYGSYGRKFSCDGPATGFQLRSKSAEWFTDETAASNLRLYCDGVYHEGDGVDWGYWTERRTCPPKSAICGLRTQIEPQSSDVTALNNIKVRCCPVPNPAKECRPTDSWDLLLACDNLEGTTPTHCTYDKRNGVSHSNKVSFNHYLLYKMYSDIGFTIPGAIIDLPGNFGFNLSQSLQTGYNWTSSSSEMWTEETSVSIRVSVPPRTRMTLSQVYGACDFYGVRANMFKREDKRKRSNTVQVTTFSFVGDTPVVISQAPDNVGAEDLGRVVSSSSTPSSFPRTIPSNLYTPDVSKSYYLERRLTTHRFVASCACLKTRAEASRIRFTRVTDSSAGRVTYVYIHDGTTAVGSPDPTSHYAILVNSRLSTVQGNPNYQWYVLKNGSYYRFINRATGMTLDSTDTNVYAHEINDGQYQDWELRE